MAQINYEDFLASEAKKEAKQASAGNKSFANSVSFFGLKNDGDSAIVRLLIDTPMDFDLVSVHDVEVNGKRRKVGCIKDTTHRCPLCEAGNYARVKLFIHMLHYTQDETGKLVAQPKVWERPGNYCRELADTIDGCGPFSNNVSKVTRIGAAGSTTVRYNIIHTLNPNTYSEDIYKKDTTALDNYHAIGHIVMDKTAEEMTAFLETGEFPAVDKNVATPKATTYETAQTTTVNTNVGAPNFDNTSFGQSAGVNRPNAETFANNNSTERPTRYSQSEF